MAEQELIRTDHAASEEDWELVPRIRKALSNYEPLRATRPALDVSVDDGRVHLRGRMRTMAMKEIAEYLVRRIDGVRAVRNDIVADPETIRAVADALAVDDQLGPACIQVDSRNGEVILMGSVPDEALIGRALDIAAGVPHVDGAKSRLVVRPDEPELFGERGDVAARDASANGTSTPGVGQERAN